MVRNDLGAGFTRRPLERLRGGVLSISLSLYRSSAMEPSTETLAEIGRLCVAWSYLERVSEQTLWGIIHAEQTWGQLVSSRLDLRGLWDLILREGPKKLAKSDITELKAINKDLTQVMQDRNIIVHGRIHAKMKLDKKPTRYEMVAKVEDNPIFEQQPCWTIFKGPAAGKCYPVSADAVEIVRANVHKVTTRVEVFNTRCRYGRAQEANDKIETDWPVPL
jgi:hypothetical protein